MMDMLGIIFSLSLLSGELAQPPNTISSLHDRDVTYTLTDFEAACGSTLIRARFSNGEPRGEVELVAVNGRSLPTAAEQLTHRVARRSISRVGILNCGTDADRPVFRGVVEVSDLESQRRQTPSLIWFRVRREGEQWRLLLD